MTVSAAIMCPMICICDIIIKAGMCALGVYYIMSCPFSTLHW